MKDPKELKEKLEDGGVKVVRGPRRPSAALGGPRGDSTELRSLVPAYFQASSL